MNSLQRRLVYIAVLLCILAGINYLFYRSDVKMIQREAVTKQWEEVTIKWQFVPIPLFRYYRVTYTDGLGVSQKKKVIVEVTETTWRDDE
jgi:hypothetical protein